MEIKVALRVDRTTPEIAVGTVGTVGTIGSEADILPLIHAVLGHELPLVRGHAAWALGRFGGRTARRALNRAWRTERDDGAREEIALALDVGT